MRNLSLLKFAIIMCIAFAFTSCGKEDSEEPALIQTIADPNTILESLEISKIQIGNGEMSFEYGSSGKLEKVVRIISFKGDWGTEELRINYELVYTNNKLTSINKRETSTVVFSNGQEVLVNTLDTTVFEYNEKGQVAKRVTTFKEDYNGDISEGSYSLIMYYNAENKLVKYRWHESRFEEDFATFEWSGNNVSKVASYYHNNTADTREKLRLRKRAESSIFRQSRTKVSELESERVFSDFDDKSNPLLINAVLDENFDGIIISRNNPRKMVWVEVDENGLAVENRITNISHEYDSKGRPVKYQASEERNGQNVDSYDIVITYKN